MLQVLLVDDEPWVLEGLRSMVNWQRHGFEVCAEAMDGSSAMMMITKLRPDLVLTDIRMPAVSGLEMIEQARRTIAKPPQFIILSGYDDFEYAKIAMRNRVADYLLKPIDEEEIELVLARISQRITEDRITAQLWSHQQSLVINHMLNRLVQGESDEGLEKEAAALLKWQEDTEVRCVLVEASPHLHSLLPAIQRSLSSAGRTFQDSRNRIGIVVSAADMEKSQLEELLEQICQEYSTPEQQVVLAVSERAHGLRSIRKLYRQALDICTAKQSEGKSGVYWHCARSVSDGTEGGAKYGVKQLLTQIAAGQSDGMKAAAEEIFAALARSRSGIPAVTAFIANLELELCRYIVRSGGDADLFMQQMREGGGALAELEDYAALKAYMLRLCAEAADLFVRLQHEHEQNTIRQVIQYVDEQFRSKLKLRGLADRFHMNPAYLGQAFKKQTGMPFNDYINTKRVEEAKRLLKRSQLKISDVARQVGYSNTDYFISKFKQATGVLPSVYKQHDGTGKPAD